MAKGETRILPQVGDTEVRIPVTLDYSGGRSQSTKSRLLWTAITLALLIFVEIGILLSAYTFLVRLFLMALIFYVVTLVLRIFLLKENKYRKELAKRIKNDYSINMSDFWGIYEIDQEYCYFLSGHVGMYIMLEKGAIVGKNLEDEYEHYEAIADAFNILGTNRLKMCHIDMMDIIGRDDRIRNAHKHINRYSQTGMKTILEDIFRYLQKSAESSVTSYDIYLFMYKGDELEFESNVQRVLSCLMSANYSSYAVLDRRRIQSLAKSLFNLHDFSVSRATQEAFSKKGRSSKTLTPISLTYGDGRIEEINKTTEQKRSEAKAKNEAAKYRKQEIERRDRKKKEERRKARNKKLNETVSRVSNNRFSLPGAHDTTGSLEGGTIDLDEGIGDDFLDLNSGTSRIVEDSEEVLNPELVDEENEEIDLASGTFISKDTSGRIDETASEDSGFFDLD